VDWFWEFPALTGPALALLGMATALGPRRSAPAGRRLPWPAAAAGALAAVLIAVSFGAPWLAERQLSRATEIWRSDPSGAFDRLDRAAGLNPLSSRAQLTAATISLRLGRTERAEREFREALEREPDNGYALLELGMIAAERGERVRARDLLRRARARSPRDQVVYQALDAVRRGREVDLDRINRRILRRARSQTASGL
jgi:tetratricopeptide (TPR) repeat protein